MLRAGVDLYVLGCPMADGKVAVLCRSSGEAPGPALCQNKIDAMKLKTNLTNDPRSHKNHRALEIIRSLLIYKISEGAAIAWEAGALWGYLDHNLLQCVESKRSWN